jgi:rhodanese-related sulfurtransferase
MDQDIEVDAERASQLIRDDAVQLVDVREAYEVAAGYIGGARHIAMGQLAAEAETIARDRPVLFYCHVGSRSGMAATAFRRAGYDAYSLTGGIEAWAQRGLPIEADGGQVAGR